MSNRFSNNFFSQRWFGPMVAAAFLAVPNLTSAQQGSWGNTGVSNGGQATFFGAHTFAVGTDAPQPGIVKTARTAPFGIVGFAATASHTGAADASHVDGYVRKYGTSAFTFPIGNGTKYRPASISAPTSGEFTAAYWSQSPSTATLPAGAPFPITNLGAGVAAVSNVEYWDVDGPSAINLTLTWDAASNLNTLTSSNINNLVVVGYSTVTNKWENLGNAGGTTGTLATSGTITANGVTPDSYTAFTFGSAAPLVTPDLRPLVSMADRNFVKPTAMSKPFTIRIGNIIAGSTTNGSFSVFLSVGSNFTAALNGATGWTLTDDGGGEYTLTTSTAIPGIGVTNIPMMLTAKPTIAKGNYSMSITIDDNAGGEANNNNNNTTADVSVTL